MRCVRRGVTEQQWVTELVDAQLAREAPDLWELEVGNINVDQGRRI